MIEPANEAYFEKIKQQHRQRQLKSDISAAKAKQKQKKENTEKLDTQKESKGLQYETNSDTLADKLLSAAAPEIDQLFHNEFREPFARVRNDDHLEIHSMRSRDFKLWLGGIGHKMLHKALGDQVVKTAVDTLSAQAIHDGPELKLSNRVAWHNGAIYYDLTNKRWQAVKITAESWEIVDEPPILFRRYTHQAPQVSPIGDGKLSDLRRFINLKVKNEHDHEWILLQVFLVSALIPDIPHPIPLFFGPQGAAKSTTQSLIGKFIDTSYTARLAPPHDRKEAVQVFAHRWYVPLDNLQTVEPWLSDLICRAVTGEAFSKRGLYTDEDDIIFAFKRVISVNGIHPALTKPDALDRAMLFELERISEENRRTEKELLTEIESLHPKILGAMFTALSKTLAIYPTINLHKMPRMADFAQWGCAIAEAIGVDQSLFLEAYRTNISGQHEETVHGNPAPSTVHEFMQDKDEWSGSPTALYDALSAIATNQKIDLRSGSWPKSPGAMTKLLKEFKHNLQELGIVIDFGKSGSRKTVIRKVTISQNGVQAVHDAHVQGNGHE